MKFSPSTNGFYIDAIHGENIPPDAVEISNEEHSALLAGQSSGKMITAGPGGVPFLASPLPPPDPIYVCSPWQIRKALNAQGLRAQIEEMVAASNDQLLKDGWEFATEFRSDDLFVLSMGAAVGKTEVETVALIQYATGL